MVRLGRNTASDGRVRRESMIVYPRIGRKVWKYPNILNFHPQARYQVNEDDIDTLSNLHYGNPDFEVFADDSAESKSRNLNKRLQFVPRVGKK